MVAEPSCTPELVRGPGIVLLDGAGRVVSATREAVEWLDELAPELLISDVGDLRLPFHAHGFAARVRAAHEDGEPQIRSRMRTRRGVWLLMHGAVLEGTGQVALIIEPAKSADVAPLIVEAYGLSGRELEVTRAIARGSAPPRSPPSCTSRRTPSATTSRHSSRRSASPAAASSCTGSSPSTTLRRRTTTADRDARGSLPDAHGETGWCGSGSAAPEQVAHRADGVQTDQSPEPLVATHLRIGATVKVALGDRHHRERDGDEHRGKRPLLR